MRVVRFGMKAIRLSSRYSSTGGRAYATLPERRKPLVPSGILKQFDQFDNTPLIGTEFPQAKLAEWIHAPNSDELLTELAITISRRNVVFFRQQDDLTNDLQKRLVQRLGELTGKPKSSGLHIHPVINPNRELGGDDLEISTISSKQMNRFFPGLNGSDRAINRQSIAAWHSDMQSEPVTADYTSLRLVELPSTGGDTVWASGYEVYDRLSPAFRQFLEGLTANFDSPFFTGLTKSAGIQIYDKPRGSPENIGTDLKATHPVIRTNPVTGWKSVYALGAFPSSINGLTATESAQILEFLMDMVYKTHELQVRFKWQNANDFAIWDNRSSIHSATVDYQAYGDRYGYRAVGIGERPYFDSESKSRTEALVLELERRVF